MKRFLSYLITSKIRLKKYRFIFHPVQERETNGNFTGCQLPLFMIVLIFFKTFLDNKMSILRYIEPLTRVIITPW